MTTPRTRARPEPAKRVLAVRFLGGAVLGMVLAVPGAEARAQGECRSLPPLLQLIAADDSTRVTGGFEGQRELREFALYAYRNIASDILEGEGPYLDALADFFRPDCADREALLGWLRPLLGGSSDATVFSRRLAVALATVQHQDPARP